MHIFFDFLPSAPNWTAPRAMAFLNVALSYFTFLSVGTLGVLLVCPADFLCGFATTSAGIQVCSQPPSCFCPLGVEETAGCTDIDSAVRASPLPGAGVSRASLSIPWFLPCLCPVLTLAGCTQGNHWHYFVGGTRSTPPHSSLITFLLFTHLLSVRHMDKPKQCRLLTLGFAFSFPAFLCYCIMTLLLTFSS